MNRLKMKFAMILPVMFAAVMGLVLSNLTMSDTPQVYAHPFDEVEVLVAPSGASASTSVSNQGGGAGFQPPANGEGECPCKCFDETQVREIVRDEFDKQLRAEQVAPRASISGATGYGESISQSVTVQPTTTRVVRTGLFGTRTVRVPVSSSSGTCRVVNGVRVCN